MKISVIGLGYVGLPLAALLAQQNSIVGFDVDSKKIKMLKKGEETINEPGLKELLQKAFSSKKLIVTDDAKEIADTELKIITVGTPYDAEKNDVDYAALDSALEIVSNNLKKGDVLMLKSTVPIGTTTKRVKDYLEKHKIKVPGSVGLVFSPERIVEGQAIRDFRELPKVIGSSDERSQKIAEQALSSLGGNIVKVSNPETAEMVKMIDNYARFVFIGLTNELALVSEKSGVDVMEALKAAKDNYPRNAGLLLPGPGVGGSCLNKDPFILKASMAKHNLELKMVDSAKEINSGMESHVASLVKNFAKERKKIAIAGVAFKGETDDTRFTPTFGISAQLKGAGFKVTLSDPAVKGNEYEIIPEILDAAKGSEILLLITDHKAYKQIDLKNLKKAMAKNPLIIDTRALIDRKAAQAEGFEYHGLGRL